VFEIFCGSASADWTFYPGDSMIDAPLPIKDTMEPKSTAESKR
jgi:hypothetical protein